MSKVWTIVALLVGWVVLAYILDVLVRPALAAKEARAAADRAGKPLLNVGAGTSGSSLRSALLGPTMWGDVNVDLAACGAPPGPIACGDIHELPFEDSHFGAAIASHVLEHVDDPEKAKAELERVTEGPVFIITPKWWAPHTWLYTDHQWYIGENGKAYPLWLRDSPTS